MIDRLVALAAVETVQVGGVFHQLCFAQMILEAASQSGSRNSWCSLGFQLLVWDVVRGKDASVTGPNTVDVGAGDETSNSHQTHPGPVQVHLSQVDLFQEL